MAFRKGLKIFDNGGKTVDRYTLITPEGDVFGFSENPHHPQGFGQYDGDYGNTLSSYRHLGKPIKPEDLPEEAQRYVIEVSEEPIYQC